MTRAPRETIPLTPPVTTTNLPSCLGREGSLRCLSHTCSLTKYQAPTMLMSSLYQIQLSTYPNMISCRSESSN